MRALPDDEGTVAVKLSVIALDYDGTIAQRDVLEQAAREAIAAARARGIVVLLVTGRILDELRRVAGDLHFVDGVIAETRVGEAQNGPTRRVRGIHARLLVPIAVACRIP